MADNSKSSQIDPGREHLGMVYAKALIGATENAGTSDAVVAEFQSVVEDVLTKSPALAEVLQSPRVGFDAKEAMLAKAFGSANPQLLNFLKVVARRGRMFAIADMYRSARQLLNELRGRLEVEVQTAVPMDASTTQLVQAQLTKTLGQQIEMTATVHPELIGGMIVRVGDTVFDTSLSERLSRMGDSTREKAAAQIRDALDRFAVDA